MKQKILFFNLLLLTYGSFAQKQVHFAHGFGGDEASWASLADEMNKCPNVVATNFEITSNKGLAVYASEFSAALESMNSDETAIAIGHSFGGANLRNMDAQGTNLFGAYMTVASPHHGAPLSTSFINGDVNNWVDHGTEKAINLLYDLTNLNPLISVVGIDFQDKIENFLVERRIISAIINLLPFADQGLTAQEMQVGGAVANLPAASMPAIGIQSAIPIDDDEFWRLMEKFGSYSLFGFNINLGVEQIATGIEHTLNATTEIIGTVQIISWLSPISLLISRDKLRDAKNSSAALHNWWKSIETSWNQLIGAGGEFTGMGTYVEDTYICLCSDINGNPVQCNGSLNQILAEANTQPILCSDDPDCWEYETIEYPIFGADKPNDGVLPLERQALPGALSSEIVDGPTHFEETESSEVRYVIASNINPNSSASPNFKIVNCLN